MTICTENAIIYILFPGFSSDIMYKVHKQKKGASSLFRASESPRVNFGCTQIAIGLELCISCLSQHRNQKTNLVGCLLIYVISFSWLQNLLRASHLSDFWFIHCRHGLWYQYKSILSNIILAILAHPNTTTIKRHYVESRRQQKSKKPAWSQGKNCIPAFAISGYQELATSWEGSLH